MIDEIIDFPVFLEKPEMWLPIVLSQQPIHVRFEFDQPGKKKKLFKWYTIISLGHLDRLMHNIHNPELFTPLTQANEAYIAGNKLTEKLPDDPRFVQIMSMKMDGVCVMMGGDRYRKLLLMKGKSSNLSELELKTRTLRAEMLHRAVARYQHQK